MALGADVVHLGQDDLSLAQARQVLNATTRDTPMTIGVSTHSFAQAETAWSAGADYIGFGPVFPTQSKENPDPVVGVDTLAQVCAASPVPVVAIGGINLITWLRSPRPAHLVPL